MPERQTRLEYRVGKKVAVLEVEQRKPGDPFTLAYQLEAIQGIGFETVMTLTMTTEP